MASQNQFRNETATNPTTTQNSTTVRCDLQVISYMADFAKTDDAYIPDAYANKTDRDNDEIPAILWTYVSPFLFLAGLTGNILSLIVLNRPPIRRSAISLALRLIAFFDCIILILGLTRHWTKYAFKFDVRNHHSAICKTHMFLVYSALDSSVWNLAALNVGRLIAVINPLKANLIFTQKRIWLAAFIITSCAMALNSHVFITRGVSYKDPGNNCGHTSELAETFWRNYLPYVVLLIYVLGPFVSFSVCNTIIIVKVHQEIEGKCKNQIETKHHQDSTMRSLTIMLVAASFTFLLLTTPNVILDFLRFTHADEPSSPNTVRFLGQLAIVDVICTLALYINHSLSFYTYLLSGTRFRQEAIAMFCPKWAPRRDGIGASMHGSNPNDAHSESRRNSLSANSQHGHTDKELHNHQKEQIKLLRPDSPISHRYAAKQHQSEKLTSSSSMGFLQNGRNANDPKINKKPSIPSNLKNAGRSIVIVVEPENSAFS